MSEPHGLLTHTGEKYASSRRALEYLPVEPPAAGEARALGDGLLWARIPLPVEPTHINVWLMDDDDGWSLVDTGMALDACREAWRMLESRTLGGRPIRRIFVTHDHPDHMGLARWLQELHDSEVWMSAAAHASSAEFMAAAPGAVEARIRAFLRSHGVPAEEGGGRGSSTSMRADLWFDGVPDLGRAPLDGDEFRAAGRAWSVIETGGHCHGHLCLHDASGAALVSGDQVLPTISPNVSVISSRPESDPLRDFLGSLDRLAECAEDTLVLPSHGRPFRGLHLRLADVRAHHLRQLDDLLAACAVPRTAFELLRVMFDRPLRGIHRVLAMGETLAHLHYLRADGRLARRLRDDGVYEFEAAGERPG